MRLSIRRAGPAALVLAAALAATATTPALRAEEGRVYTVQSEADLKKRADALMQGLATGGAKVTFGSVEKGATANGLVIKNIEIVGPDKNKYTIELIEVRDYDWENPQQSKVADLSMKKLVIPPEALDKEAADLGLTQLTINADFQWQFDDAKKTMEISNLFVDIVELMEMRIKLKLLGLSLADIKAATGDKAKGDKDKKDQEAGMKLLANLNLAGATIALKDKSLVERAIRSHAKKQSMTEAAAKAQMLEMLAEQRKKAEDDATKEFLDAASKFLANPGTIELVASPAAPANVMMAFMAVMSSPATLKQMLGLSIAVK